MIDKGSWIPKGCCDVISGNEPVHIISYGTTINNNSQVPQICSYTVERHRYTECSAEIDDRGEPILVNG